MEDKITLDRESFRTLASKTRVNILKSLDSRRKMLSELAKQFGMSPSTIKEHMDNLSRAGLVVQIDDGHKWKYYELTPKGREIVNPTGTRIFVILGLSLFALPRPRGVKIRASSSSSAHAKSLFSFPSSKMRQIVSVCFFAVLYPEETAWSTNFQSRVLVKA